MGRRKADALDSRYPLYRLKQLYEWAFTVPLGKFVSSVHVHDLAKQGYFFDATCRQLLHFGNNFVDWTTALIASGGWHDTKRTMHVASLHDRDESAHRPLRQQMIADGTLRAGIFLHVNNRKSDVVPTSRVFFVQCLFDIFCYPVKFLGTNDQIEVSNVLKQRRSAALCHASEQTVNYRAFLR